MLFNTLLLNSENAKDKNKKNTTINSCHFNIESLTHSSDNNSFNKNLSKADNIID